MKKIFKTITIYLGVLLLAGVATTIFCAGFLFFYRDGNIFGIQYIKTDKIIYARESADMANLERIEINSKNYDVAVKVNPNVDNLIGAMRNKVFGYAIKSKAQAKFTLEYNEVTRTATFNTVEPKGWLNKSDAYIEIAIPQDFAENVIDLVISTNKGDITVGGSNSWDIGKINVKSSKGDASFKNIIINETLTLSPGSGCFSVANSCSTATGGINARLSVGSGTIDLTKFDTEKFKLNTVEIVKNSRGEINILQAKELVSNGNINGGGKIQVKEIGFVDFTSLDTNVYINSIVNNATSRIKLTGTGKAIINRALCSLEITADDGDIKVGSATGTLALSTRHGDIKVVEALKLVSAVTIYGNIDISFGESALDYADTTINDGNKNRAVIATTKNGHIIVKGLQNGTITATESGRISLSYDRVVGDNVIVGSLGAVNIVVPNPETNESNECAFNLKVNSGVSADIKVGAAGSIGRVDFSESGIHEFTNIYNNASSTTNNLNIESSTGPIKIRSLDLVKY